MAKTQTRQQPKNRAHVVIRPMFFEIVEQRVGGKTVVTWWRATKVRTTQGDDFIWLGGSWPQVRRSVPRKLRAACQRAAIMLHKRALRTKKMPGTELTVEVLVESRKFEITERKGPDAVAMSWGTSFLVNTKLGDVMTWRHKDEPKSRKIPQVLRAACKAAAGELLKVEKRAKRKEKK